MFCALLGGLFVYGYLLMFDKTLMGKSLITLDTYIAPVGAAMILGFFYATVIFLLMVFLTNSTRHSKDYSISQSKLSPNVIY